MRCGAVLLSFVSVVTAVFPPPFEESKIEGIPSGHLKPLGHHRPPDGPVAEEQGFLHPRTFWEKYVRHNKPMVFRQAVGKSPALTKWDDQYLAENYGDFDVLFEVKRENRSKGARRMNISTFLQVYNKQDVYAVTLLPEPMGRDIQVPMCLLCGTFRDYVHETNFWMSSGGTNSVVHYDADENLHCIIQGSKDFMMINKQFEDFLPMEQKGRYSGSAYSNMNTDSVDLLKLPNVSKVQWTYTTLYPGDCVYIPSQHIHQVRSHKRTISATILFTTDVDRTFEDKGCEDEKFEYTPLTDIDIHWTYNKGDRTVDMGYMNLELLRKNVLDHFDDSNTDFFTLEDFHEFVLSSISDEEKLDEDDIERLYVSVFDKEPNEKVLQQDMIDLPREKLKLLARSIDSPHGPVKGEDDDDDDTDQQKPEKDEL